MPSIDATSKPQLAGMSELTSYLHSMTGDDVQYVPRSSWVKVDLSKFPMVKIPERFGHAMATVSGSRVLIYGGIGCAVWSGAGVCQSTLVLNDLWGELSK